MSPAMEDMNDYYDPLSWENLMAALVVHLERQPRMGLTAIDNVRGPGVYVLFYSGLYPAYAPISGGPQPIYAGKAMPKGTRKGTVEKDTGRTALRSRLSQHRNSIEAATNLDVNDFECRFLTVVPVWITLAEQFLIDHYGPVWNKALDGFGNNPQGKDRETGKASLWDTLHPGREWAAKRVRTRSEEEVFALVAEFFRT